MDKAKKWKRKHPEAVKEYNRRYKEKHPETYKASGRTGSIKYRYGLIAERSGLSLDDLVFIWENVKQCAICGRGISGKKRCMDHDHVTGKFRGILCHPCNTSLGLLSDRADVLRKAADYLENFSKGIDYKGVYAIQRDVTGNAPDHAVRPKFWPAGLPES